VSTLWRRLQLYIECHVFVLFVLVKSEKETKAMELIITIISDETYTLLQLTNELEPKLHELSSMYCIHTRGVYDWKTSPNWLSASWYVSLSLQSLNLLI
jgi:hypothetical protein